MKTSQIAAKIVTRLFFFLLLIALVPFVNGDTSKLQHLYLTPKHSWTLAFPILLILGFITLLVICSIKRFSKTDLNWLLVLNTVVLMAYAITLYIRIYQLIK
jgi:quinol-cytochrome oxidoreductase complex cytochrome b subunit